MATSTKWIVGFLTIIIAATVVTVTLMQDVRLKVDATKATFYVYENGKWNISGVEYLKIYNGTRQIKQLSASIDTQKEDNRVVITRTARYNNSVTVVDIYSFDGSLRDKESFPLKHEIIVFNATGLTLQYQIQQLTYGGPTLRVDNLHKMSFGKNMVVTWQTGATYAQISNTNVLTVKYKIKSAKDIFNVRFYDPATCTTTYSTVNLQASGTENLADAYVRSGNVGTNFGTATQLQFRNDSSFGDSPVFIQFNLSMIPTGASIIDAESCFFIQTNSLEAGDSYTIKPVLINRTFFFNETNVSWSTRPTGASITGIYGVSATIANAVTGPYCFNVTGIIGNATLFNYPNATMMFFVGQTSGTLDNDALLVGAREHATVSQRPSLNITYSTFIPCTCEDNLTNGNSCVANQSITFSTPTIFNVNATSASTGALTVTSNNITVDCNGSVLSGNGTGSGIKADGKINLTIKNCNINNYGMRGIWLANGRNELVINNVINNSDGGQGIRLQNTTSSIVTNNTLFNLTTGIWFDSYAILNNITYNTISLGQTGVLIGSNSLYANIFYNSFINVNLTAIRFDSSNFTNVMYNVMTAPTELVTNTYGIYSFNSSYSTIQNNVVNGYLSGIKIFQPSLYNNVTFNNVTNQGGVGIIANSNANNTLICNNRVINSSRNGIGFLSYYNTICNNYIENFNHNGIDTHNDVVGELVSGYTSIYGNNLTITAPSIYFDNTEGMYLDATTWNNVYNNRIINIFSNNSDHNGIAVDDQTISFYNNIYNNYLENVGVYCLVDAAAYTNWTGNTLVSCNKSVKYAVSNGTYINNFGNNNFGTESVNYNITNSHANLTINENSNQLMLYLDFVSASVNFNYVGFKNLSISGNRIDIRSTSSNYSVFNVSSGLVVANNVANYSLTVGSGESFTIVKSSASGGCDYPLDRGMLNYSTNLCPGVYNLPNGNLTLNANNMELNCNGAVLNGTSIDLSRGIFANARYNITIMNCSVQNYYRGILATGVGDNITIINNTATDTVLKTSNGIYVWRMSHSRILNNFVEGFSVGIQAQGSNHSLIDSNVVSDSKWGIYLTESAPIYESDYSNITNNLVYNVSGLSIASDFTNYLRIYSNTVLGNSTGNGTVQITTSQGVDIFNNTIINLFWGVTNPAIIVSTSNLSTIRNNFINRSNSGIYLSGTNHSTVTGNTVLNADVGLRIVHSNNITHNSNNYQNITLNSDGYNIAIYVYHNSDTVIGTNETVEYGHIGEWVQQSSNISINNITCNQISLQDVINGRIRNARKNSARGWGDYHYNEPTACILLGENYEGWLGDSTENTADNITKFRQYNVTNVVVEGITANSDVQTYIHTVGVFGTTSYTIPAYWYRKFWMPTDMTDADEFYNNNAWDVLQIVPTNISGISTIFWKSRVGMANYIYTNINYSISNTSINFTNVNRTVSYNLSISNGTLAIPYNSLKNISSGNVIARSIDFYNVTVAPFEIFSLGKFDTCSCPLNSKWNISLADGCIITSACTISGYDITFYDTGNITFNSTITAKDIIVGSANIYIGNNARINLGG